MTKRRAPLRPPFEELPKHKRSDAVIKLKGRMKRFASEYGGRFSSRLILNEPGRPWYFNQDFSFYFPGEGRFTIWNARVLTARKAFWGEVSDLAYKSASAMLTLQERLEDGKMEFVPAERSSTGKVLSYTRVDRERKRFAQFEGRTYSEQCKKLREEIIQNSPPAIHESFAIDFKYVYGAGLRIVLDVDEVNQSVIEMAIDRFMANGEQEWVSPIAVARDRLPWLDEMPWYKAQAGVEG